MNLGSEQDVEVSSHTHTQSESSIIQRIKSTSVNFFQPLSCVVVSRSQTLCYPLPTTRREVKGLEHRAALCSTGSLGRKLQSIGMNIIMGKCVVVYGCPFLRAVLSRDSLLLWMKLRLSSVKFSCWVTGI